MIIQNAGGFYDCIHEDDLFICTFGYEQRSVFLYEQIVNKNICIKCNIRV